MVGTFTTPLAGGQYRKGVHWEAIRPGDPITFRRDPYGQTVGLKHKDPNALAVFVGDQFIGYLPANRAKVLAPAIDVGDVKLTGRIKWIAGPSNVHLVCTLADAAPPVVTDDMIQAAIARAKQIPVETQGE